MSEAEVRETAIRILEKEECLALRPLWEEVFYEDSEAFTDYYFREKAVRNRGFVLQGAGGRTEEVRAMLYLSPYPMMLRVGNGWECREICYIVGVATKKEYRHRGYMNRLLRAALKDMYVRKQPFTFLMPASPAIYEPYQFTYIYDRQEYVLGKNENEPTDFILETEIADLAAFASDWLARHCDVFIRRDEDYYQVLVKELEAQNGGICLLCSSDAGTKPENKINGYFLYAKEGEKEEIQEAVLADIAEQSRVEAVERTSCPFQLKQEKTPIIMARIIDVREMLSLLRKDGDVTAEQMTEDHVIEVILEIHDPILEENSGSWWCRWSKERAHIERVPENRNRDRLKVSVENLTAWVFGYKPAVECFEVPADTGVEVLSGVKVLGRVFLNEIV